ncbi:MAG TPA: DUF4290 domain-containing protein [Chitinophagales bacterium]|nr:DUF4290 domain-containing protein [Chitinophagales bacterium]
MEYNTQRPQLLISEYGRYIQNMVRAVAKIDDQEKRNAMARAIIELMSQASPQFRNIEEYKHKLWDHLIMISDFKLVVDSPYPFPERRSVVIGGTAPLPYPKHKIKMRHYGRNLQALVAKAKDTDEEKRKAMAEVAANYMKLCYANWSKESVSDETVRTDLESLSKGLLELDKDYTFSEITPIKQSEFRPIRKNFGHKGGHKKNRNFTPGNKFNKRRRDR